MYMNFFFPFQYHYQTLVSPTVNHTVFKIFIYLETFLSELRLKNT